MKRTKFSKLVSVMLAVCVMLLGVATVSAETEAETEAKAYVNAEQDLKSTKVTVDGFTANINRAGVTLVVLGPDLDDPETPEKNEAEEKVDSMIDAGVWDEKVVASVGQVFAENKGENKGKYTYEFVLKTDATSGEYILIATSNDIAETTFYFANPGDITKALQDILDAKPNEETGETIEEVIVGIIDDNGKALGIDADFWSELSDAAKIDAADAIKTALGKMTDKEDVEKVKQIDAEALTAALNAGEVEDIETQESKVTDKEAIKEYRALTDDAKKYAMDLISNKGYDSAANMEDALAEAVEIAFMVVDGTTDLEKFGQSAEALGLEKAENFGDLTDTQKRAVADAVAAAANQISEAEDAGAKLDTIFKTEVGKYITVTEEKPKEPTYISNGGGGNGNKEEKPQITYIDLGGYDWAKDAIYSLSEKNVLAGYGDGIFNPSNQIKREEFTKVIVAALYGEEAINTNKASGFADAKSGWYTPFISYAESIGLIKGVSETEFGVGNNITRQDIMTILYRAMQSKGYRANTTAVAYGDAAEIADYAKDAVFALANAGVVGGYEDGYIRPAGQATRAEVAVMVDKFMKLF